MKISSSTRSRAVVVDPKDDRTGKDFRPRHHRGDRPRRGGLGNGEDALKCLYSLTISDFYPVTNRLLTPTATRPPSRPAGGLY
jgi:hypothetical protein